MTLDELTQHWTATLHATLEKHCPMKSVSNSTHPPPSPWMTPELRVLLLKRKHLHRKWRKHPNDKRLRQEFRAARRAGTLLNRRLREAYYICQFSSNAANAHAQWKVLNRLLGRHKLPATLPVDPSALTMVFEAQFTSPDSSTSASRRPAGPPIQRAFISFKPVSVNTISSMLRRLKTWKATGSDGLPPVTDSS